jgi:hypothetical protein
MERGAVAVSMALLVVRSRPGSTAGGPATPSASAQTGNVRGGVDPMQLHGLGGAYERPIASFRRRVFNVSLSVARKDGPGRSCIIQVNARAFSGEVDPVHRRKCVKEQEESRFHVNGNGSSA